MFLKPKTITSQTKSNSGRPSFPPFSGGWEEEGKNKAPPLGNREFPEWLTCLKYPECTPGSGDLAAVMHPRLMGKEGVIRVPDSGSPSTITQHPPQGAQNFLTRDPRPGGHSKSSGVRAAGPSRDAGAWESANSPSWQQQLIILLLPKPKPGPPRLPAQGELEDWSRDLPFLLAQATMGGIGGTPLPSEWHRLRWPWLRLRGGREKPEELGSDRHLTLVPEDRLTPLPLGRSKEKKPRNKTCIHALLQR